MVFSWLRIFVQRPRSQYRPLRNTDDETKHGVPISLSWRLGFACCTLTFLVALLEALLLLGIVTWCAISWTLSDFSGRKNPALRGSSFFSPILDLVEIPLNTYQMEATLLETEPRTVFRMPPSAEVDAAWRRVSDLKPIAISKQDVIALGKDPRRAAKWPESEGFGPEAYIGRIDAFHQIHCLDALRREAHFDYYYGHKFPGGQNTTDEFHKLHVSHCVHLILQNLMCNANVDIYTHFWADSHEFVYPDFNVNHKCRSFETLLEWQNEHGIEEERLFSLRRPVEYGPPQRMTRKFKELFGFLSSDVGDWEGDVIG